MDLGLLENKALIYLISKIQPKDKPGKIYVFNCKEFQALLNWNAEASYINIRTMLQNLGDKSMWIDGEINGRKKDILIRWFDIVHLDPGNGDIEISFHRDMFPFLIDLKKHMVEEGHYYTTYKLQNVALMKHRYSPRIYELLKSYQCNNKKWTFENGTGSEFDLQRRIADTMLDKKTRKAIPKIPSGWSNWAVFKRNILDPAIEEINRYTDIKVAYEGKKTDMSRQKTRAIRSIEFYMVGKTIPEQRETDALIDAEYTENEYMQDYHKMSIEEQFFYNHENSLKEEKANQIKSHETRWSVLFSELNEERDANLDEKKIKQLYDAAIKGRVAGNVSQNQWELYATDLVTYYYDKISATTEDTKTTTFKRLLDSVKNDYDSEAIELLERYRK